MSIISTIYKYKILIKFYLKKKPNKIKSTTKYKITKQI